MQRVSLYVFLFSLLVIGITTSCDNSVDINDEYEEITIVYGLLDQSVDQHYVKITKAFQTEGNVYLAAANSEVTQYDPNDLKVYIEEYNANGNWKRDIMLDTVLITNKEEGDFYYPDQIIYATEPNTILNFDYTYKLKIELLQSGNIIESSTGLVNDFSIVSPRSVTTMIDFSSKYNTTVKWNAALNGTLHQLNIRYFYTEVTAGGVSSSHYVDWIMPLQSTSLSDGTDDVTVNYVGVSFYDLLAAQVSLPKAGMIRYSDSLQFLFTVAHEDFAIYLDVNKPSTSIVQERPSFSNVSNGIGLFSSRFNKVRSFSSISERSLDSLYNGSKTYMLGFTPRTN